VRLDQHDPERWVDDQLVLADAALQRAADHGAPGPFQLEAAIQSAMTHGTRAGHLDHPAIEALYDALYAMAPTCGIGVGRAAARLQSQGPQACLDLLDALTGTEHVQPWWAVRAEALRQLGDPAAHAAYEQAIALARDPAVQDHLKRRALGRSETR